MLQPDGDVARVREAIEQVIAAIEPPAFAQANFDIQWLVGIQGDYDELRSSAARLFLPSAPGRPMDLAAWIDGDLGGEGGDYALECGILEGIEAPPRLARATGRFMGAP